MIAFFVIALLVGTAVAEPLTCPAVETMLLTKAEMVVVDEEAVEKTINAENQVILERPLALPDVINIFTVGSDDAPTATVGEETYSFLSYTFLPIEKDQAAVVEVVFANQDNPSHTARAVVPLILADNDDSNINAVVNSDLHDLRFLRMLNAKDDTTSPTSKEVSLQWVAEIFGASKQIKKTEAGKHGQNHKVFLTDCITVSAESMRPYFPKNAQSD